MFPIIEKLNAAVFTNGRPAKVKVSFTEWAVEKKKPFGSFPEFVAKVLFTLGKVIGTAWAEVVKSNKTAETTEAFARAIVRMGGVFEASKLNPSISRQRSMESAVPRKLALLDTEGNEHVSISNLY